MEDSRQPIRILHVTFNMGFGGTEQVIRQLVGNLPPESFHNEIVCIDGFVGDIGQQLSSGGTGIHTLSRGQGLDFGLARQLRRIIRQQRIDVVHCHQYTPFFYGWLASLGLRARVVFTEHGRFHPDRHRYKARLINPLMARMTSKLVAISDATREALVEYEFMPRSRIDVIYNGIQGFKKDYESAARLKHQLGIPASGFVLGTVSRLDPVKNQRMMLRAFQLSQAQCADVWLLMVGDGPDRDMLTDYAHELGVSDRVIFTGFQSEPASYLRAMDVFLLSSHTEGTSMTLLEAMSLGIPSVATAVGGNPEVIEDGYSGLLVPSEDDKSMADAIIRLQRGKGLRLELSSQCLQSFRQRFSVPTMIESYSHCYRCRPEA